MQTSDEGDTTGIRYRNLEQGSVEIVLQEETSIDEETRHDNEIVGVIALWGPTLTKDDLAEGGEEPTDPTDPGEGEGEFYF
jgi:hypothetical protein